MDDLPGGLILFIHIHPDEVIVSLIGSNPLMKVFEAGKVFEIKKLQFNGTVNGLDIAVIAPGPIGNAFMDAPELQTTWKGCRERGRWI
jgi:hypothetical protein